jgi:hypothetical protein
MLRYPAIAVVPPGKDHATWAMSIPALSQIPTLVGSIEKVLKQAQKTPVDELPI